ncbi:aerobic respiration two-component sensor histidine kinase ArcB [Salinivibrio kushneri]|uniref:Aerobic respiration control sensor protein n=1 Tax=Salinivibrio kushneri TaxID=1908198 RepID=A0AB36KDA4_9GAMM|nr:aerobic respiration two-component sensor histidine kinase ArcB [Salinivibrio kushneri]OOE35323.1 aerobic respiration two-component sensor histidine kinase ArcB [Salinivibrio kushneri]OOE42002.1 aerobic respiration two-component sensor histidine kinase ArcB [Salinivibrio kushneri]OOE46389.1 aerobic respiration two-component sensor histidine kinase ArcB [Salinivibrio kushneri]OOE48485.1 aerobic respiration two-component sensor histidine kinase ArcB [Salinivibrio kushneri]OOE55945.1 aerobic re
MKQLKVLAQYYVDLLVKLGIVRFSMLLALALVALAVVVQVGITLVLEGTVQNIDIIRSVFFGLVITPWAVYFLSVVVDQLEESRQRLSKLVSKLEEMRARDMRLNRQLTENIEQLNSEIEEREKAESARQQAIKDLENEVYQREKAQLELAEQTALLRSFIDASPDLIYYRNADGQFSGCNRAMEELTGYDEKTLKGLTPWDVYREDIAEKVVETDQQVFDANVSITYEQWLEYQDGRKAYFELRKVPFFARDGRHLGLLGFGREITERKRYQDALEKASREKTAFISTISHELRTPLNGIVGLSRMLLESNLDDKQRNYLRTIYVSAITLGNIFNDIIDLDKSDRKRLSLHPTSVDFNEFVTEIDNISELMAEQKGLRFELERVTELPDYVAVDTTRLRQILWNLVGNAVKFTKQGCVIVTVSADVTGDHADLCFEVEDSGIGIPADEQDKIFAMYYQVKQAGENLHAVGTGIGLAVSRKLARLMGGDITLDSEEGEGSTFTVTLRVPLSEPGEAETPALAPVENTLRILLVEDIELNITVATSLLESLGHQVTVARDGQSALDVFSPDAFDLALLDIQLPDMTGFDIAATWREQYVQLPPLVALTANVINDKNSYLANGMDDAISKPISVSALNQVIEQHALSSTTMTDVETASDPVPSRPIANEQAERLLDMDMLTGYVALVGVDPVKQSIEMFESTMPEYIAILDSNMTARDQEGIVSEAHKIKGAAGSVGLKHIQKVAQKAQSPELPAWWENIADWIDEIKDGYQHDLDVLKAWLDEQE